MIDLNGFGVSTLGQLLTPRPDSTFEVSFTVKVNGTPLPTQFAVTSIQTYKAVGKIPFAVLTLHDGNPAARDFQVSNTNFFTPGNDLEILAGYHQQEELIFRGVVVRHGVKIRQNAPPVLEIECKDAAVKMTVERKNKYFLNQKDSEIAEEILRTYTRRTKTPTISVARDEVDTTSAQHREMVQFFATDWDFLQMRAEANGLLVVATDGQVRVKAPAFDAPPVFTAAYGTSLFEFEAEMDARDQYPDAQTRSWNPADQKVAEMLADENGASGGGGGLLGDAVSAVRSGVNAANDLAAQAGLDLNLPGGQPDTDFKQTLGATHRRLQHSGNLATPEQEAWAKAQYTKSRLARLCGRARIQGTHTVLPGDVINFDGVGGRHSGPALVTAVLHELGGGTWFTQVQFGLEQRWFAQQYADVADQPAAALLPPVHGLQIGVVTALASDPEGEQRIQVRLPLVDARAGGIWTRLAAQDAGNNRGAVWRPEINDEVIVGFLNDDPRDGVVLGSLHSSKNAAPLSASDQNPEKGWVTRNGIRVILNDQNKSVVVETPGGKKLTLDDNAGKAQLEDENGNKITLDSSGITVDSASNLKLKAAQAISLEAPQISAAAQSSLKLEAQGQTQVTSSGDLVVKGAFVRIN